jgi:hypothetical protein
VNVPLAATVTVELADCVTRALTLVGLALMLMPGGGPVTGIVAVTAVEFVIKFRAPPLTVITTLYEPPRVPEYVQTEVMLPPTGTLTGEAQLTASWPAPVGPVITGVTVTKPAKPLVAGGLPRLVTVT